MPELKPKSASIYSIPTDGADEKRKYTCEKEYDPYQFGNTENPIDFWDSVVHLIRSTIGTGILILPFAFRNVGWSVGLIGSIFIGIVYLNTVHALLFTEYELCKRLNVRNLTFVAVVNETFTLCPKALQKLRGFFKFLMYFYYGVPIGNAIYLIIIATNLKGIVDHMCESDISVNHMIVIIVVPVTLLCLIPKLKFLVPLSILTNIFTVLNVIVILFHSMNFRQIRDDVKPVENLNNIPQFVSMVLQSLYATGIVLPLKNNMRTPKDFAKGAGVFNISSAIIITVYTMFGLIGYINYGTDVEENILLNLPQGSYITTAVYILYSAALCVTYTLVFYVYFDTLWSNVVKDMVSSDHETLTAYGLRLALSIVAFIMAMAIPDFALLTTIVGTIGILLEISLPAIVQIVLLLTSDGYNTLTVCKIVCKNTIALVLAMSMFVMSFKHCILQVIALYSR